MAKCRARWNNEENEGVCVIIMKTKAGDRRVKSWEYFRAKPPGSG